MIETKVLRTTALLSLLGIGFGAGLIYLGSPSNTARQIPNIPGTTCMSEYFNCQIASLDNNGTGSLRISEIKPLSVPFSELPGMDRYVPAVTGPDGALSTEPGFQNIEIPFPDAKSGDDISLIFRQASDAESKRNEQSREQLGLWGITLITLSTALGGLGLWATSKIHGKEEPDSTTDESSGPTESVLLPRTNLALSLLLWGLEKFGGAIEEYQAKREERLTSGMNDPLDENQEMGLLRSSMRDGETNSWWNDDSNQGGDSNSF